MAAGYAADVLEYYKDFSNLPPTDILLVYIPVAFNIICMDISILPLISLPLLPIILYLDYHVADSWQLPICQATIVTSCKAVGRQWLSV